MSVQIEHVSSVNENPVITVKMDGTVLQSNEASKPLLKEWRIGVGNKLTSNVVGFIHKVISRNSPEKTEIKVGNRTYQVIFSPLPEQKLVSISGFDISYQKDIDVRNVEIDVLFPSGKCKTFLGSASPLHSDNGNVRGSIGTFQDITERKRAEDTLNEAYDNLEEKVKERTAELEIAYKSLKDSEEKYRNFVETANEGIALVNSEGMITYVNKKMEDMLGYTEGEIIGAYTWDFVEDKSTAVILLENKRKGFADSIEIKQIRKDCLPLWVHLNSKPIFDNNGKFMGSLGMFTDITERKKAEEEIKHLETARKKEIHHRIKNNLQVISSLLDLQADKLRYKKNITKSEVLEAFKESQDRVISMALIHEELHKSEDTDTLNFSSYIEELADNLLSTYRTGNNGIFLDTGIEEDIFFDMDTSVPLGIIVNELVSNSLKHAFPDRYNGEIQIKLNRENGKCKIEDNKSNNYVLLVSDNGIGIPEDLDIEDLDSLGLQLVTTLVEQLDGELELKRNSGTEFVIKFSINH